MWIPLELFERTIPKMPNSFIVVVIIIITSCCSRLLSLFIVIVVWLLHSSLLQPCSALLFRCLLHPSLSNHRSLFDLDCLLWVNVSFVFVVAVHSRYGDNRLLTVFAGRSYSFSRLCLFCFLKNSIALCTCLLMDLSKRHRRSWKRCYESPPPRNRVWLTCIIVRMVIASTSIHYLFHSFCVLALLLSLLLSLCLFGPFTVFHRVKRLSCISFCFIHHYVVLFTWSQGAVFLYLHSIAYGLSRLAHQ